MNFIDDILDLPSADPSEYYVDHFDLHGDDAFEVFQTFRPESPQAVLNIKDPDTITYEISFDAKDIEGAPVVTPPAGPSSVPFIGPYRTGWLLRQGNIPISAGPHTSTNTKLGTDFMKVGGHSWLKHPDRRGIPFDPRPDVDELTGFVTSTAFGPSLGALPDPYPQGLLYQESGRDIALIVKDILDHIYAESPYSDYSPPITYDLSAIGKTIDYSIPVADSDKILSKISSLSEIAPGFDYRISWDMIFEMWSPYRYGDPASAEDPDSPQWVWTFDADNPEGFDLEFTNTGPGATHVYGDGSGPNNNGRFARAFGYEPGHAQFWRLDESYNFSNMTSLQNLIDTTQKQLAFDLNPIHEIPLSCYPDAFEDFWIVFQPGLAVWINWDVVFHVIDSAHRILSMTLTIPPTGDAQVDFGLNQIYDTEDAVGDPEA